MKNRIKRIITLLSALALVLVSIFYITKSAYASSDGIARFGDTLSTELPSSFATNGVGATAGQTIDNTWIWADDSNDYFGLPDTQTFVVKNSDSTKYDTVNVSVQTRLITPTLKYGNEEGNIPASWNGNSSKEVIDTYQHTVTVTGTGGTVSGSGTYTQGQSYTISATPSSNYKFTNWSDNNTSSSRTLTMNTSDVVYIAAFESAKTVTVATNSTSYGTVSISGTPSGTVSGTSSTSKKFFNGDSYTITASAKSGYKFVKWSDNNTSASRIITMGNSNASYTATFESTDTIAVTNSLPTKDGDVSIMPLYQLYSLCKTDPVNSYNGSRYYVYGICDSTGYTGSDTGSTSTNLQAVGLQWYKQLNKPATASQTWTQAGHILFGGPLCNVARSGGDYYFHWWYSASNTKGSNYSHYWSNGVDTSVYVAVVRSAA